MEGDERSLLSFMDRLNKNNKNIVLSWKYDKQYMVSLDIEMYIQEGGLFTINY